MKINTGNSVPAATVMREAEKPLTLLLFVGMNTSEPQELVQAVTITARLSVTRARANTRLCEVSQRQAILVLY